MCRGQYSSQKFVFLKQKKCKLKCNARGSLVQNVGTNQQEEGRKVVRGPLIYASTRKQMTILNY